MQQPPASPQPQGTSQSLQPGPLGEQWHGTPPPSQPFYQPQYQQPPQSFGMPPQAYPAQQQYAPPPMQQQAPYPQQPMYPPPAMQQTVVNVNMQQKQHGLFVRAIYFIFIGSWLGFFWLNLGFFLCSLIITLPLGLIMLNRLPQVMTLRSPGTSTKVNVATAQMTMTGAPGQPGSMVSVQNINVTVGGTQQINFFVRALYFVFFGFWAGFVWAYLAYFLCLLIVTLPIGVIMFNRLPMVLTLRKN